MDHLPQHWVDGDITSLSPKRLHERTCAAGRRPTRSLGNAGASLLFLVPWARDLGGFPRNIGQRVGEGAHQMEIN